MKDSILFGRSHFSYGDSLLSPEQLAECAADNNYTAAALADTMNISGLIPFTRACQKHGVKPIVGARIRVVPDPAQKKPKKGEIAKPNPECFFDLYIASDEGFEDLTRLVSLGNSDNHFYYVPRVSLDELCATIEKGHVVVSTSDVFSCFCLDDAREYMDTIAAAAKHTASADKCTPESSLFVRIEAISTPLYDRLNSCAMDIALALDLPIIGTYSAIYESPDRADAKDVYNTIMRNAKMDQPWRRIPYTRDFAPLPIRDVIMRTRATVERVSASSKRVASALESHQTLCDRIKYEWTPPGITLPTMADDEHAELVKLCKAGMRERIGNPVLGYTPPKTDFAAYAKRLSYELGILEKMDFSGYFLLVRDLVVWSKDNGIMVGPGRGSVGGSLVAYLIGITDVDPIRFGLLFERFINPERIDLPDADLDFMSSRRSEAVEYMARRHGVENVTGISNYTTMAAGAALRNVGRVFGLDNQQLSPSKLVPKQSGQPVPLEQAAEEVADIQRFKDTYPEIWRHAVALEGQLRSMGRHAAGLAVAGEPVVKRGIIERRSNQYCVNWDKRTVEDMGLVKLDMLGLSTLDVLSRALDLIRDRHGNDLELLALPLDDEATLTAFSKGDTTAVFQFESSGMRNLLQDLAVTGTLSFEDLSAATALYRPGPIESGLLQDYVENKQSHDEPVYEHPNMTAALKETQGVIVYQEQVMRVAQDLAGFSLSEADFLRKAMGKKDPTKMATMRDKWVDGCVNVSSMAEDAANALFDRIEKFAGYAFNKSHSVEYSIISYWCQYLRVHYAAEFYAASLDIADEDKRRPLLEAIEGAGILLAPPDIEHSTDHFEVGYDTKRETTTILMPFNAVKGVSEKGAQAILDARRRCDGHFDSEACLVEAVDARRCNVRVRERLRKVGAFAHIDPKEKDVWHPDRLKDQIELLPGLINRVVKADRSIPSDKFVKAKLIHLINEVRERDDLPLSGGIHPTPRMGSKPKFMVVSDCPNWSEDQAGKLLEGKACEFVKLAIKNAGLRLNDGYFTTLVKSIKGDEGITNEMINAYGPYLDREIEILNPPVILALGGKSIRYLVPGVKGGWADLCGQTHYNAKHGRTIVLGLNPGQVAFDSAKQDLLDGVFEQVASAVK